jgi:hypothetical protein
VSKWIKQDAYHIKNGEWIIAKYFSADKVKYGLSHANRSLGFFDSADSAKAKWKELTNG